MKSANEGLVEFKGELQRQVEELRVDNKDLKDTQKTQKEQIDNLVQEMSSIKDKKEEEMNVLRSRLVGGEGDQVGIEQLDTLNPRMDKKQSTKE